MTSSLRRFALVAIACSSLPALLPGVRAAAAEAPPVRATEEGGSLTLDNGTIVVVFSETRGGITSIQYRHDGQKTEMANTMYYSWSASPTEKVNNEPIPANAGAVHAGKQPVRLLRSTPDAAEVVMEEGPTPAFPFHTETHYVLPRGESGFYAYQIYSRGADLPAADLGEARFVIKGVPGSGLYTHHVVDASHGMEPLSTSPTDRKVMDATYLLKDGTVYTKYDNSAFMADHYVHGMAGHGVGIWMVNASNEYVNGGPVKQELTVHQGDTLLNMLEGAHFGAGVTQFQHGETWTKFYGPFFVYLNSAPTVPALYADAVRRDNAEREKWPYTWVHQPDYPTVRGTVAGQLRLADGKPTAGAWVVLAAPGGDWPLQGKGYEFWTQAGADGAFQIPKVRPGRYTLYAYGANQFEQFVRDGVEIQPGRTTDLGALAWQPVTHGRQLWQIGTPDRSSQEYHDGDNVRHWANYLRYPKAFPEDVTFTIGKSHERTDWNFAQWTWFSKRPYWAIDFSLPAPQSGKATLTLGFASSNPVKGDHTNLQVKVNGQEVAVLHLPKSGAAGYRSGGQDSLYQVQYVTFDAALLKAGANEITLGHQEAEPFPTPEIQMQGKVGEVMYDALRLEVGQ